MTNEPTPETDAEMSYRPPTAQPWYVPYEFARGLEIQRNAALAERDIASSLGEHAMFCVHHTDAQREANTVGGNCPICNKAQIRQLRADVARLRAALEGMLIAEMEGLQLDGFSADEVETEPHWMAARAALDTPAK